MSVLIVFTCPATGRDIPVAVLQRGELLDEMGSKEITVTCLECGQNHNWLFKDGRLAFSDGLAAPEIRERRQEHR